MTSKKTTNQQQLLFNHDTSCLERFIKEEKEYPNMPSAIPLVPNRKGLPVPEAPESFSFKVQEAVDKDEEENGDYIPRPSTSMDPNYNHESFSKPHHITQGELHNLVRDLELLKNMAVLLSSRLQQWNLPTAYAGGSQILISPTIV